MSETTAKSEVAELVELVAFLNRRADAHLVRAGERLRRAERHRASGDLRGHALFCDAADREVDVADACRETAAGHLARLERLVGGAS